MTVKAASDVWTFSDFRPGYHFGEMSITLGADRLSQWKAIYGSGPDGKDVAQAVPHGLLVTCMMEAYLGLIQPRPPGNIHAGQSLVFGPGRVRLGDTVTMTASCLDTAERKGRGWVTFEVIVSNGSETLLRGAIRTIWAR